MQDAHMCADCRRMWMLKNWRRRLQGWKAWWRTWVPSHSDSWTREHAVNNLSSQVYTPLQTVFHMTSRPSSTMSMMMNEREKTVDSVWTIILTATVA